MLNTGYDFIAFGGLLASLITCTAALARDMGARIDRRYVLGERWSGSSSHRGDPFWEAIA